MGLDKLYDSLVAFAMDPAFGGYRPGKIEVRDAESAKDLTGLLAEAEIAVEFRKEAALSNRAQSTHPTHTRRLSSP